MAELADALGSGSSGRKAVGVQLPLPAIIRVLEHRTCEIRRFQDEKIRRELHLPAFI